MTENSKYNLLIIVAYLKKICFLFYVFHKHSVDTQIMFFFFFFTITALTARASSARRVVLMQQTYLRFTNMMQFFKFTNFALNSRR